ncbi:3038_t:CDS:2, partial [Funneliformis geosporum]
MLNSKRGKDKGALRKCKKREMETVEERETRLNLQEHGFGKKSGSIAINPQQIQQILQHPRLCVKNNQCRIQEEEAQIISISSDDN